MAIATAASAAAMVMINRVKKTPSAFAGNRNLLNAIKLIFTEFRINSTAISIEIMFRRVMKPYTPIKNSAVLRKR
jgi:hypothetical protein